MAKHQITTREVDNPYWSPEKDGDERFPRKIEVAVNTRDCSFMQMHSRGQIDDAQLAAVERFHRFYYLASQGGATAIDTTREPVDGGRVTDGLPVSRLTALTELGRVARELGTRDYQLMQWFAGEGYSIGFIAEEKLFGRIPSQREREYCGTRIRDAIDVTACIWGYKDRRAVDGLD